MKKTPSDKKIKKTPATKWVLTPIGKLPKITGVHIDELRRIGERLTRDEEYLAVSLEKLALQIFSVLPDTEFDKQIIKHARWYAAVRANFEPLELPEVFIGHLHYLKSKLERSVQTYKHRGSSLSDAEKRKLYQDDFLSATKLARLFRVGRRQVFRWKDAGELARGRTSKKDYLSFSRRSFKYGFVVRDFNKLMKPRRKI